MKPSNIELAINLLAFASIVAFWGWAIFSPATHPLGNMKPHPQKTRKDTMPPPPPKPRGIVDPDKVIKVEPKMVKQQFWP